MHGPFSDPNNVLFLAIGVLSILGFAVACAIDALVRMWRGRR